MRKKTKSPFFSGCLLFFYFVFIGSKTHKHNVHTVTEIMYQHTLENRLTEINYLKKKERKKEK